MTLQEFFTVRLPHIYLLYGFAFSALGLAVALESSRALDSRFKRALRLLAVFGLVHGFHEWFEMFEIVGQQTYSFVAPGWLEWLRLLVLAFSFTALGAFGVQMLHTGKGSNVTELGLGLGLLFFYGLGVVTIGAWLDWSEADWLKATDAWTRYTLGISGALLAAAGMLAQRRILLKEGLSLYANSLIWSALAFALYGAVGQFMVSPSALFPSTVINSERFLNVVGVPVQLFRTAMAALVAVFTIRAMRAFDVHRRRQLDAAQQQAQEAIARRDTLRGELLRRSVSTQEEERSRIARELHDEIGQTLTGLATGLRGVQQSLNGDPNHVRLQLRQLEGMTARAMSELSRLVSDLRPSLLDDMGLHTALNWYVDQVNRRGQAPVDLTLEGSRDRLPPEVETTLFRIAQEALTNVTRHSQASQAVVKLVCDDTLAQLHIHDDGVGFDPARILEGGTQLGWGLVGIQERVSLAGGDCRIESAPGEGTTLTVKIPLTAWQEEHNDAHQADAG
ncbi:MAG: sensor histidine kinase [Anaerolineae bacterium]|jgi:signal transduction histidine kinase